MKKFIKTSYFTWFFDVKHTSKGSKDNSWKSGIWQQNDWIVKKDSLEEGLDELVRFCNDNQYEIKGILPINKTRSYDYGQAFYSNTSMAGLGHGWGVNIMDGFSAIVQSVENLSDIEYQNKLNEVSLEKNKIETINKIEITISELKLNLAQLDAGIDEINLICNAPITENKRGIVRSKKLYIINGQGFSTLNEAELYVDQFKGNRDNLLKKKAYVSEKIASYITECNVIINSN